MSRSSVVQDLNNAFYPSPYTVAGTAAWWDASRADTVTTVGSTTNVSAWASVGSENFTLSEATSANQPTYITDANGFPCIYFDNSNPNTLKGLDCGSSYIFSTGDGLTIIAVTRMLYSDGTASKFILDFGNFSSDGYGLAMCNGIARYYTPNNFGGVTSAPTTSVFMAPSVTSAVFTFGASGTQVLRQNGVQVNSAAITTTALTATQIAEAATRQASSGPVSVGRQSKTTEQAGRGFNGYIYELIVIRHALNTEAILRIEDYLSQKWDIGFAPTAINGCAVWMDPTQTSSAAFAGTTLTGTNFATTAGSYTITGTGSLFLAEVAVGDYIRLAPAAGNSQVFQVYSVASNTSITTVQPAFNSFSIGAGTAKVGTQISAINNLGTLGGTFDQATLGQQPEWYTNIDSMQTSALWFDGSVMDMVSSVAATNYKFLHDGTGATVFFTAKLDSDFTGPSGLFGTANALDGSSRGAALAVVHNTGIGIQYAYDFFALNQSAAPYTSISIIKNGRTTVDQWAIFALRIKFEDTYAYMDGSLIEHQTASDTSPESGDPGVSLTIGSIGGLASSFFKGLIGEIIIYNKQLNENDFQRVTSYLQRKWGVRQGYDPREDTNLALWYDPSYAAYRSLVTTAGTGTVAVNASSSGTTLIGTGTLFSTELNLDDYLTITGTRFSYDVQVIGIASDTSATISPSLVKGGIPPGATFVFGQRKITSLSNRAASDSATLYPVAATGGSEPTWLPNYYATGVDGVQFADPGVPLQIINTDDPAMPVTSTVIASRNNVSPTGFYEYMYDGSGFFNFKSYAMTDFQELRLLSGAFAGVTDIYFPNKLHISLTRWQTDATSSIEMNGVTIASEIDLGTSTWEGLTLGADNANILPFSGQLGEFLRHNSSLSAESALQLNAYLKNKYQEPKLVTPMVSSKCALWADFSVAAYQQITSSQIVSTKQLGSADVTISRDTTGPAWNAAKMKGLPVATFNGTSSRFLVGAGADWDFLHNDTESELWFVFLLPSDAGTNQTLFATSDSAGTGFDMRFIASTQTLNLNVYDGGVLALTITTSSLSAARNVPHIARWRKLGSNATSTIFTDNAQVGLATAGTLAAGSATTGLYIGSNSGASGEFYSGYMMEFSAHKATLGESAADSLYTYYRNKWIP